MNPIKHFMLDFYLVLSITMSDLKVLDKFYESLQETDAPKKAERPYIPSSTVVYARRAILDKLGIDVPLLKLEVILWDEGLLPAAEYGIPYWFRKKYQMA